MTHIATGRTIQSNRKQPCLYTTSQNLPRGVVPATASSNSTALAQIVSCFAPRGDRGHRGEMDSCAPSHVEIRANKSTGEVHRTSGTSSDRPWVPLGPPGRPTPICPVPPTASLRRRSSAACQILPRHARAARVGVRCVHFKRLGRM